MLDRAREIVGALIDGLDPGKIAFALSAAEQTSVLGPLADLVRAHQLSQDQRLNALRTLAALGGPQEHALVVRELPGLAPRQATTLLTALQRSRPDAPRRLTRRCS